MTEQNKDELDEVTELRLKFQKEISMSREMVDDVIELEQSALEFLEQEALKYGVDISEYVAMAINNFMYYNFKSKHPKENVMDLAEMIILLEMDQEIQTEYTIFNNFAPNKPYKLVPLDKKEKHEIEEIENSIIDNYINGDTTINSGPN